MEAEKEQSAVKSTKSSVKVKLERHKRRAHFFPLRRFRHSFKTSALNRTGDGKRRSFSGYFSLVIICPAEAEFSNGRILRRAILCVT